MKLPRAIAALAAATLVLAACSSGTEPKTREPSTPSGTDSASDPESDPGQTSGYDPLEGTDSELADFYGQDVAWDSCGANLQCSDITVPLDYENPNDGRTLSIAVAILDTAGDGSPGLFLNPGGPGGSGVDMLEWIEWSVSSDVTADYNMVGFDPRGVNHSDAVACLDGPGWDERNSASWDISTDEGWDQYIADTQAFVDACAANTDADLLEYIDTYSAARDLDILRAVVGQKETLDYLGYSYGTFLGAHYAELFPERVGAFVLDGAVDPSIGIDGISAGQTGGFELAIRNYMEDCLAGSGCPFSGSVDDGLDQLQTFFDVVEATPLPTDDPDRSLTLSLAVSGVIIGLYESSIWPQTTQALAAAMNENDGSELLFWADQGSGRNPDGTYEDNSSDAFLAIECLDYPVEGTLEDWQANAEQLKEVSPFWEDSFAYTEVVCDLWPHEAKRTPAPLAASGSAPILVIGTTGDPATPYEWSVAMADQLENGHLLTFEGNGHTAYGRSNNCVANAVDAFLLDGTIPAEGATC